MARRPAHPAPWYRKSRSRWYVTTPDGTQHATRVTDPNDFAGAQAAAIELLADRVAAKVITASQTSCENTRNSHGRDGKPLVLAGDHRVADVTVADAITAYLTLTQARAIAGKVGFATVTNYRTILTHLRTMFGHRDVGSLMAAELEDWANRPAWSPTTQRVSLRTVQQCLRHQGISLKLDVPHAESRGADTVVTTEQFAAILADLEKRKGDLPNLLRVLWETGARPSEITGLKAETVDWANACARLTSHKTRRKTGADRVIHFSREAMRVLEEQKGKRGPTGFLFRTRSGGAFSRNALVRRMMEVSERVGFRCIAYGFRHGFCSRALASGVPDTVVAALVGHKSTNMIHKHYDHIAENARLLKDSLEKMGRLAG